MDEPRAFQCGGLRAVARFDVAEHLAAGRQGKRLEQWLQLCVEGGMNGQVEEQGLAAPADVRHQGRVTRDRAALRDHQPDLDVFIIPHLLHQSQVGPLEHARPDVSQPCVAQVWRTGLGAEHVQRRPVLPVSRNHPDIAGPVVSEMRRLERGVIRVFHVARFRHDASEPEAVVKPVGMGVVARGQREVATAPGPEIRHLFGHDVPGYTLAAVFRPGVHVADDADPVVLADHDIADRPVLQAAEVEPGFKGLDPSGEDLVEMPLLVARLVCQDRPDEWRVVVRRVVVRGKNVVRRQHDADLERLARA